MNHRLMPLRHNILNPLDLASLVILFPDTCDVPFSPSISEKCSVLNLEYLDSAGSSVLSLTLSPSLLRGLLPRFPWAMPAAPFFLKRARSLLACLSESWGSSCLQRMSFTLEWICSAGGWLSG